jgi:hypothetical protein
MTFVGVHGASESLPTVRLAPDLRFTGLPDLSLSYDHSVA